MLTHAMRSDVVIEEEDAYRTWLREQETFAQSLARAKNERDGGSQLASSESAGSKPVRNAPN